MSENDIELVKLSEKNKREYLSLEVNDYQKDFIETPRGSLDDMKKQSWDIPWIIECIYGDGHMIGYTMHGINKNGDVWLDRFMIDRHYQNHGYGTKALAAIIEMLKKIYPDRRRILLSAEPDNNVAIKLYEHFGFFLTGEIEDGECIMQLKE